MDCNAHYVLHQRQVLIGRWAKAAQAVEFFRLLTSPQPLATTEALPQRMSRGATPVTRRPRASCLARPAHTSTSRCQAADALDPLARSGGQAMMATMVPLGFCRAICMPGAGEVEGAGQPVIS